MSALWFRTALLPQGWRAGVRITIEAGRIVTITTEVAAQQGDETHGIGLPGLCNLHSHAFQRAMAGFAEGSGGDPDSFWSWRDVMYHFVDRLDPDDAESIAAQAYVEMLEAGFTRVGEFHYLHNDRNGGRYDDPAEMAMRIAAAAAETGIGLTLLPVFYAHGGFGQPIGDSGQRRFFSDLDGFATLFERSRTALTGDGVLGLAPHSLRAATTSEIAELLPLLPRGPLHIHVAEQTQEIADCLAATGQRPVELLLSSVEVDPRWCLIHATHVTDAELSGIARSGAVAGLCPVTEANLGDGVFPLAAYSRLSGRLGVGSDSNVLISAATEMRSLEYAQRLTLRRRNVLGIPGLASSGRWLFDACLAGGGQALAAPTGLSEGFSADMVSLRENHPSLAGCHGDQILDAWIFGAPTMLTDCVWRAGRKVVRDGGHVAADAVAARYRRTLGRIFV